MADPFLDGEGEIERAEHISPRKTGDNIQAKRVATYVWNGSSWERMTQPGGTSGGAPKDTDRFGIQAISDDGTYKYFFFESDDADYYIMRKHKTNKTFTYTAGTGGYAAVYVSSSAGPSGSPTWADRGATFPV